MSVLEVKDLSTYYRRGSSIVKAVDGVSFRIAKGEALALVGESGSGKSTVARSLINLIGESGRIVKGEIVFEGEDLLKKSKEDMQEIRGKLITIIFQNPYTFLNPVIPVGTQIAEVIALHRKVKLREAYPEAIQKLRDVRIPQPETTAKKYPHQLSGGMRQRVMAAMAIANNPHLLIADEPTTGLDVITQDEFMTLLRNLKSKFNMSLLLITHDLAIVAETCNNVAIMYAGKVVEYGSVSTIFSEPSHPYTQLLLQSISRIDSKESKFVVATGNVPDLTNLPNGCSFHPRCPYATQLCTDKVPNLLEMENGRLVACWHPQL